MGFGGGGFGNFRGRAPKAATVPRRSAPRAITLVWSRAHHDRRNRESLFRRAFYAPGWRIEPRSVCGPLALQARCDCGLVPGAAWHCHDDLPTLFLAQPPGALHAAFDNLAIGR